MLKNLVSVLQKPVISQLIINAAFACPNAKDKIKLSFFLQIFSDFRVILQLLKKNILEIQKMRRSHGKLSLKIHYQMHHLKKLPLKALLMEKWLKNGLTHDKQFP